MHEDHLKREIGSLAEGIQPPASDARQVVRGGTRLRRRRRAGVGVAAVVAVVGVGATIGNLTASRTSDDGLTAGGGGPAAVQEAGNPRVATFAVRAAAQAGLVDPTGDLNDYESVQPNGGASWLVSFDTMICDATTSCDPHPRGDVTLQVEIERGTLVVSDASGPMSENSRQKLLSYEETAAPETLGLEFPVVRIEQTADEGISVVSSPLWRGALTGSSGTTVECHVELYDENGDVIYEGPSREQPVPETESLRAGTQHIFGVPTADVQGEPATADVLCETS